MDNATKTLVAVPAALAEAARAAAGEWDAAGADSMFRNPALHPVGDPDNVYVFSYGWIGDEHLPDIEAAAGWFAGARIVAAHPFETALEQAGLQRTVVDLPR